MGYGSYIKVGNSVTTLANDLIEMSESSTVHYCTVCTARYYLSLVPLLDCEKLNTDQNIR